MANELKPDKTMPDPRNKKEVLTRAYGVFKRIQDLNEDQQTITGVYDIYPTSCTTDERKAGEISVAVSVPITISGEEYVNRFSSLAIRNDRDYFHQFYLYLQEIATLDPEMHQRLASFGIIVEDWQPTCDEIIIS